MRTFATVQTLVSQDSDQRHQLLDQFTSFDDSDPTTSATYQSSRLSLAALAADVVFDFGGVTAASMVFIIAYQDVTVKLNGIGSPAIPIRMIPATVNSQVLSNLQKFDQPGVVLWRGKVTSLHFGNLNAIDPAEVFVALVGNAA